MQPAFDAFGERVAKGRRVRRAVQAGPGQVYPTYPPMTVADYAARNGVEVEALLMALNAEAEARQFAADRPLPFIDTGPEAR